MYVSLAIVVTLLLIILVAVVDYTLIKISNYFDIKSGVNVSEIRINTADEISAKIETTVEVFQIIRSLIDNSVSDLLQPYRSLNTKYDMTKLDNNIGEIANRVYSALSPTILTGDAMVVTPDYLMDLIITETRIRLLNVVTLYNAEDTFNKEE